MIPHLQISADIRKVSIPWHNVRVVRYLGRRAAEVCFLWVFFFPEGNFFLREIVRTRELSKQTKNKTSQMYGFYFPLLTESLLLIKSLGWKNQVGHHSKESDRNKVGTFPRSSWFASSLCNTVTITAILMDAIHYGPIIPEPKRRAKIKDLSSGCGA